MPMRLFITLNARLRPFDRGDRYEDPLDEALSAKFTGVEVTGGGTMLTAEREPAYCDIDLDVEGDPEEVLALAVATLEAAGAPKGSTAAVDEGEPVPFGVTEGVAIYLNGTDLPDEVYRTSDINELITALLESLAAEGDMQSYWQGPTETALYLYGPSAARIRDLTAGVLARFPLADRCRVVDLPLTRS
ncbi:hypothetical protein JIG36_22685 [Actinoplanes sp. LDG1-06]|uniref:Uncharacterized protein n=1 Tax=Paractinoplanes ovalisporus TaxID=2810368 RepID=A0ABS2AEW2_9ACTN|nr:hypothetical protein [Actinoplanes ovalisporus]MBM2618372.1 hypothetical protein [Actinoplanes ovalisporus]